MTTINGTANADNINLTDSNDIVKAGASDDNIFGGAFFNALDKIDGGEGEFDRLRLDGDYSKTVFKADTIKHVEYLDLAKGHDYSFKLHNGNVAAGEWLHVVTGGGDGRLVFDGSAEKDGAFGVEGMKGDDVLTGGSSAEGDAFYLQSGGNDTVVGNAGDDIVYFGNAFTVNDRFNGGAGYDAIDLDGDYSSGLQLGADTLVSIEEIQIRSDKSVNDVITAHDNLVSAGETCFIHARDEKSYIGLSFDGSAETDGHFEFVLGAADSTLKGGAQSDKFTMHWGSKDKLYGNGGDDAFIARSAFDEKDFIDGGEGKDSLTLGSFEKSAALTLSAKNAANIEAVYFVDGTAIRTVTAEDSFAAAGTTMNVYGGYLQGQQSIVWNGAAEKDAQYYFTGGSAQDVFAGGAKDDSFDLRYGGEDSAFGNGGKDIFVFEGTFNAQFTIDGGSGEDSVHLDGDYNAPVKFNKATVTNVEAIYLNKAHDYSLTLHENTIKSGEKLEIGAYWMNKDDFIRIDDRAETSGSLRVSAGKTFLNQQSFVLGGSGTDDRISLDGDYSKGITFGSGTLTGVEEMWLGANNGYKITTHDTTVAAGARLTVDAYYIGKDHALVFDGSAETDGSFTVNTGLGDDVVTGGAKADIISASSGGGEDTFVGGAGNDTFKMAGTWTTADKIEGGAGNDAVWLEGGATITLGSGTGMVDIETLRLGHGGAYKIKVLDAAVALNEVLTVNGLYLTASDKLTFDGSKETDARLIVTGGDGNDKLTGGAVTDVLKGGDGNDVLDGRNGFDTLDGGIGNDVLKGGEGSDHLKGGDGDDSLDGGEGIDFLDGGIGRDTLKGGTEADQLKGGDGNDVLDGNSGDDILDGGAGKDILRGGEGTDTADYSNAKSSVSVLLSIGVGMQGDAVGDKFTSIENLTGGYYADYLEGDAAANVLKGNGSGDTLHGGAGADTLDGGWGNDTADYSGSEAVLVDLNSGLGHWGDAQGDKLVFIENLTGSAFNDILFGDAKSNVLAGKDGDDFIRGHGGQDFFDGGAGDDTIHSDGSYNTFIFNGTDWGKDTITGFGTHGNKLDLRGNGFTSAEVHVTYTQGDWVVTTSHGSVVLLDVAGGSLTAGMFLL